MKKIHIALGFLFVLLSTSAFLIPLCISSDPGWGILALKSMLQGAAFRHTIVPDISDISKDVEAFGTWWTPGQYLVPAIFVYTFGLSIGHSVALSVIIFSLLGILGFYKLFVMYGFQEKIAMTSLIVIAFQRYFLFPFSIYNGGEVLLFGAMPWVYMSYEKFSDLKLINFPLLVGVSILAFFMKSTFLTALLAIILYLFSSKIYLKSKGFINNDTLLKTILKKENVLYSFKLLILFTIIFVILYYYFTRFNNPSNKTKSFDFELMDLLVPFSSPLVSAFSIDDLLNRIFNFPGFHSISKIRANPVYFFGPLAIVNMLIFYVVFKKRRMSTYLFLVACHLVVYISVFGYFYLFDAAISYEFRHFRILGVLATPLFVTFALESEKTLRTITSAFIIISLSYGMASFVQRKHHVQTSYVVGRHHYKQMNIDGETMRRVHHLDDSLRAGNNLFYFTSPEVALEIEYNRVMSSHAEFESLSKLDGRRYGGKVDNLFLLLQKKLEGGGKDQVIMKSFVDYKDFEAIYENENYKILKGIPK